MELAFLIIKTFLISHIVVKFEPLQWVLDVIRTKIGNNMILNLIVNIISVLTSCLKCTSFWIGLIVGGIWPAIITSYIAYLYGWLIEPKIEVYKNPI